MGPTAGNGVEPVSDAPVLVALQPIAVTRPSTSEVDNPAVTIFDS
jgi:hypothetical protein